MIAFTIKQAKVPYCIEPLLHSLEAYSAPACFDTPAGLMQLSSLDPA
jgi:hypothetical protein